MSERIEAARAKVHVLARDSQPGLFTWTEALYKALDAFEDEVRAEYAPLVAAASYYIDRLERVQRRQVVRDLAEAQAGWNAARAALEQVEANG